VNSREIEAIGCSHLYKRFGDLVANRDVSLSIEAGEVHAVIGENGAGKSTLMKSLYGLEPPDSGEVRLRGEIIAHPSVSQSLRRGVGMVHQHFMLVPTLTVAENVMLGHEVLDGAFLDVEAAANQLEALSKQFGLALDPRRLVSELGVGEAQRVEIVKVLWRGAEVLILDEPTAVLTPLEVDELFVVLRGLVKGGKTVIIVTHKLDEVLALADRVSVMRRGELVETVDAKQTDKKTLARLMVGRDVESVVDRPRAAAGERVRFSVSQLSGLRFDDVSFEIHAGEILGVAGVEGNGQTELTLALAGVLPVRSGEIAIDGKVCTYEHISIRQSMGLAHIPEDRHARGLILSMSLADNLFLGREPAYSRFLRIDTPRLLADTRDVIDRFDVRPAEPAALASSLSGGNQQKLVVGRELLRKPSVILCAQPTRGVDVGAIERIHQELLAARAAGCAILLLSAELDELLALADRTCVLYRGRLVGILPRAKATRTALGAMMLGASS
jgi:simple sugar transport system ATP-binding protein